MCSYLHYVNIPIEIKERALKLKKTNYLICNVLNFLIDDVFQMLYSKSTNKLIIDMCFVYANPASGVQNDTSSIFDKILQPLDRCHCSWTFYTIIYYHSSIQHHFIDMQYHTSFFWKFASHASLNPILIKLF